MKKIKKSHLILLLVGLFFLGSLIYLIPRKPARGVFETTGIIEATEVNLSSKITEKIKEINVEEGSSVEEGEIIVKLDEEKRTAERNQARANLEVARADVLTSRLKVEDTNRDLGRISKLFEKNLVSQNDYDKAKTSYDLAVSALNKAQASVKQQEAALSLAEENLKDTIITSSLSGTVTLKAFEEGETVPQGATIITVVDTKNIWARVDAEETYVAKIKLGQTAYVKVDALPKQEFKGKITQINNVGEFATQRDVRRGRQDIKTFRVKVKIDEPKGILKPGMSARVKFTPLEIDTFK